MTEKKSLVIVQPYIPKYRVAFFEQLQAALEVHNISCMIAASNPDSVQSSRGDSANPEWLIPIRQRRVAIGRRSVGLGGARPSWKGADAVIVGHLGSSLDTYTALLDSKLNGIKVGLWGHIKPYVTKGHPLDLALERWQLREADQIFAYTPGGATYAADLGIEPDKITTVMNAIDTTALSTAVGKISEADVLAFTVRHGLTLGRTLAYIGGLDESKRIDFLAETLDILWLADPTVKVVVGGKGDQADRLERSVARGQTIMLGYVDPVQQALIGRIASALLMPGRIGLVAVDALILGIPVITTDWPYHAPEVEYLVEGQSRITSANTAVSYTETVLNFLLDRENCLAHDSPDSSNVLPTIEKMVENYVTGVLSMMNREDA